MSKDFLDALNQLAMERNLDKLELVTNFENALKHSYEKNIEPGKEIDVIIDPESGELEVLVIRKVVEEVLNPDTEISLEDALELDDEIAVGMELEFPVDPERFTRIALQTTKQVITQKIREAEKQMILDEYKDRTGEVMTATVSRLDNKRNVFVDLGRGEALLTVREQIHGERYPIGNRIKVYIKEVISSNRGPSILVSRSAPELLEYLMKQEIPEIADGTVTLKAVAREAGQRSKVAVTSNNPNVDPIGACIGQRGSRIQAVTSELQRERVDVIEWDPNPAEFIRNALSPAKVGKIIINDDEKEAIVSVPSDQLSLAIGKSGQNVRLAAKLTGYKLDLKPTETVGDLDAAVLAASEEGDEPSMVSGSKKAAFDALFTDSSDTQKEKAEE